MFHFANKLQQFLNSHSFLNYLSKKYKINHC